MWKHDIFAMSGWQNGLVMLMKFLKNQTENLSLMKIDSFPLSNVFKFNVNFL